MSSHTARRSRITHLLVAKISPATIQLLVGHADLATLMKYVNVGLDDLKKALDHYNKIRQEKNNNESE